MKSLNIPQFNPNNRTYEDILDLVIEVIINYRKIFSIFAISRNFASNPRFDVRHVNRKNLLKEIKTFYI